MSTKQTTISDDKLLAWKIKDTFTRFSELVAQGIERGFDIETDFQEGTIDISRVVEEELS